MPNPKKSLLDAAAGAGAGAGAGAAAGAPPNPPNRSPKPDDAAGAGAAAGAGSLLDPDPGGAGKATRDTNPRKCTTHHAWSTTTGVSVGTTARSGPGHSITYAPSQSLQAHRTPVQPQHAAGHGVFSGPSHGWSALPSTACLQGQGLAPPTLAHALLASTTWVAKANRQQRSCRKG